MKHKGIALGGAWQNRCSLIVRPSPDGPQRMIRRYEVFEMKRVRYVALRVAAFAHRASSMKSSEALYARGRSAISLN